VLLLYYSQISQHALYLENTVHENCHGAKFGTLTLRVMSCETRILKTVRNDLCCQATLQSTSIHCKIQNPQLI